MKSINLCFVLLAALVVSSCQQCSAQNKIPINTKTSMKEIATNHPFEVQKTDAEWKQILTPEQYAILRQKGTERPFTSKFEDHYDGGTYTCGACGNPLFSSDGKFDSGCGWPSFFEALDSTKIVTQTDNSHGMSRIEIMCAKCGGHLGHVFNDGPKDKTGLRYCVNGASLDFKKK